MDALPRDSPQHPDHEWVNDTRSKMDVITCHKVNSPFECVKIQKEITRRSHIALDVDGLPGWISKTTKPHDWIGVGDFVLGADGLRPGLASLQACRRAGSTRALFSFPSPLLGPSSFLRRDNYGAQIHIRVSAF
jgi:hypothetical protein